MGLVIVLIPANFPAHPSPEWASYDALPDPIGWALVLAGVWVLGRRTSIDLALTKFLGAAALVVSVPLWFPQLNHLLVPAYNPGIDTSGQWFASLPQTLFGFVLATSIARAGQDHGDRYLAGRFGVLRWGFAALIVLPAIVYGGHLTDLQTPTLVLVGVVNVAFVYYLFAGHRREPLGGPGPRHRTTPGGADQTTPSE